MAAPVSAVNFHQFQVNGRDYTIIPAGFIENGCEAYEVLDESDEFIDTVFRSPLHDLEVVAETWASSH